MKADTENEAIKKFVNQIMFGMMDNECPLLNVLMKLKLKYVLTAIENKLKTNKNCKNESIKTKYKQ